MAEAIDEEQHSITSDDVLILFFLIEDGDVENLREILQNHSCYASVIDKDYNLLDEDDPTRPLHWAVQHNQIEICELPLEYGCDINAVIGKEELKSPLHVAVEETVQPQVMEFLIERGANLELNDHLDCTPLGLLFMEPGPENQFQFEKFSILLEAGASVNTSSCYGSRPLHGSVKAYHSKKCEEMHDNADIPLCVRVTKLLLEKGANINARDSSLHTALHFAAGDGCNYVVMLLLEHGADVDARDTSGITPLHNLARHTTPALDDRYGNMARFLEKRVKCLELLLSFNADIYMATHMGETVLFWLLSRPSETTCTMLVALLKHGADARARNFRMQTPLHYLRVDVDERMRAVNFKATEEVVKKTIDIMIANGADIDAKDINGFSPLVSAVLRNDFNLAKVFIDKGASTKSSDKFGRSIQHLIEIERVGEKCKLLFKDVPEKENLDVFGLKPDGYKENAKTAIAGGGEICQKNYLQPTFLEIDEDFPGDIIEENDDDDDDGDDDLQTKILMTILGNILSPIDQQIDKGQHVEELKAKLGDIDAFCDKQLKQTGVGKVIMTSALKEIQKEVDILLRRIADAVRNADARMAFTPVLSGSMSEGTKVGNLDEFDYLLYMDNISNMCEITEADSVIPGFVHIRSKDGLPLDQRTNIFRESDKALIANIFGSYLYQLIQRVLCKEQIWDSLHFYWDSGPLRALLGASNISNLILKWAGTENNGLTLSIDLAPVIHVTNWRPQGIKEKSKFLRVPVKAFGSLIVVSKAAPEEETFEGGNDTYLRLSYSHIEREVFLSFPQHIRDSYVLAKILISKKIWPMLKPEDNKAPVRISSYLLKMALFTVLERLMEDQDGTGEEDTQRLPSSSGIEGIRKLTSEMFSYLEECIKNRNLRSYFLPKQNILRYHRLIAINDRIVCSIIKNLLV